jgi:hypothetical protein
LNTADGKSIGFGIAIVLACVPEGCGKACIISGVGGVAATGPIIGVGVHHLIGSRCVAGACGQDCHAIVIGAIPGAPKGFGFELGAHGSGAGAVTDGAVKLSPFAIAGEVPTWGTDALDAAGYGARTSAFLGGFGPSVESAGSTAGAIGVGEAVFFDDGFVGGGGSADFGANIDVFGEPFLATHLNGAVDALVSGVFELHAGVKGCDVHLVHIALGGIEAGRIPGEGALWRGEGLNFDIPGAVLTDGAVDLSLPLGIAALPFEFIAQEGVDAGSADFGVDSHKTRVLRNQFFTDKDIVDAPSFEGDCVSAE